MINTKQFDNHLNTEILNIYKYKCLIISISCILIEILKYTLKLWYEKLST
jgi:hypothetical protein